MWLDFPITDFVDFSPPNKGFGPTWTIASYKTKATIELAILHRDNLGGKWSEFATF